jgi:ABC-type branched-subunit amino acid transport system substrate-binding protein
MTSKLNRKESRHARTPHGEMDGWCPAGRRDRPGRSDPARAVDPITIGFGMALTGGLAPNGKAALLAMQIWAEEINAKAACSGRRSNSTITTTSPIEATKPWVIRPPAARHPP